MKLVYLARILKTKSAEPRTRCKSRLEIFVYIILCSHYHYGSIYSKQVLQPTYFANPVLFVPREETRFLVKCKNLVLYVLHMTMISSQN